MHSSKTRANRIGVWRGDVCRRLVMICRDLNCSRRRSWSSTAANSRRSARETADRTHPPKWKRRLSSYAKRSRRCENRCVIRTVRRSLMFCRFRANPMPGGPGWREQEIPAAAIGKRSRFFPFWRQAAFLGACADFCQCGLVFPRVAWKTSWQRSHFRILEIPFDTMRAQNFTRSAMRIISSSLIEVPAIEMLRLPTTAF